MGDINIKLNSRMDDSSIQSKSWFQNKVQNHSSKFKTRTKILIFHNSLISQ